MNMQECTCQLHVHEGSTRSRDLARHITHRRHINCTGHTPSNAHLTSACRDTKHWDTAAQDPGPGPVQVYMSDPRVKQTERVNGSVQQSAC